MFHLLQREYKLPVPDTSHLATTDVSRQVAPGPRSRTSGKAATADAYS